MSPLAALALHHLDRRQIPHALRYFHGDLAAGADPRTHSGHRWTAYMLLGNYPRAWIESDLCPPPVRAIPAGARVLIRCLRGLGDALQFLRFLPPLRRLSPRIAVQAPERILPLLDRSPFIGELVPLDYPLRPVARTDLEIEASDLPYLFRTTACALPDPAAYLDLAPRPSRTRQNGLRVGLVWTAGAWNPTRSIPPDLLLPLARLPRVTLFSLQREAAPFCPEMFRPTERDDGTMLDTVATLQSLDLLITVDSMPAHLAGLLGIPTWTLLPFHADWRWMLHSRTPWYASMRLFRQPSPGDWPGALDTLARDLARGTAPELL